MNPCKYCSYHALLGSQDSDPENVLAKELRKDNRPDQHKSPVELCMDGWMDACRHDMRVCVCVYDMH